MNAPQAATHTAWAKITRNPGQPIPSKFGGAGIPTTVDINGQVEKVFAPTGEGLENLQIGDEFVVEWRANQWRCARVQPPELMQTLRSRSVMPPPVYTAPQPPMNAAPPPMSGGTPPRVGAPQPPTSNCCVPDVGEWLEIYQALVSAGVSDAVAAANCIFARRTQKSHSSMN
jgi:hypothetical protein